MGESNGPAPAVAADVVYPEGDGKPLAETGIHVLVITALIAALRYYFHHRPDVYVIGNIFLYYREGHPQARRAPDIMVCKGVAPGERRSFMTWRERTVPSLIIEITSRETADEDLGPKRQLYQELGVREYFLFDPLHEYLERPLLGFRLIGEEYEPLEPATDGGLLSAELGLRLVPENANLALFRYRTGERLPSPPEAYDLLERAQQQLQQERQRANQAEQQLQEVRQRAEQLAAELERLRPPAAGQSPEAAQP